MGGGKKHLRNFLGGNNASIGWNLIPRNKGLAGLIQENQWLISLCNALFLGGWEGPAINDGFEVSKMFSFGRCSPFFGEDESKFMRISQHSFQMGGSNH